MREATVWIIIGSLALFAFIGWKNITPDYDYVVTFPDGSQTFCDYYQRNECGLKLMSCNVGDKRVDFECVINVKIEKVEE